MLQGKQRLPLKRINLLMISNPQIAKKSTLPELYVLSGGKDKTITQNGIVSLSNSKPRTTLPPSITSTYGFFSTTIETGVTSQNNLQSGGDNSMDESTKMLLERIERDSREREERYHREAQEREERYRADMLEQDRRFRQDLKEREERMVSLVNGISTDISDVKTEFTETKKHVQSLVTTNIWGMIATVLAIVALAITIFLAGN